MGGQENCTRASKKRGLSSMSIADQRRQQFPAKKKRVALGDVTNTAGEFGSGLIRIPKLHDAKMANGTKRMPAKKNKEVQTVQPSEKMELADNCSADDSEKCAYAPFIYQHLHSLEVEEKRRPLSNYMEKIQKDITPSMREILVDWLVEVAEEYKLVPDTLYLTVSYLDRFLSSNSLSRNKLQLLGVSSMLIASKYEELTPPHVEDFCYITDNTYTKEEVVDMENKVLKVLNFEMGNPTAKTFLRIFTRAAQESSMVNEMELEFLGWYLAELSLLDYTCVRFLPSTIAASAIFLSRFTLQSDLHPWSMTLQKYTGYRASELKECVLAIHKLQICRKGANLKSIRDKYLHHKFECVAAMSSPSEIPQNYFEAIRD